MKVAVLYGGKSGEHEVSLRSAASIVRNMNRAHKLYLIGITKSGAWHLQPDYVLETCLEGESPMELRTDSPTVLIVPGTGLRVYGARGSADLTVDAVFPALHGTYGEDGTIQGLLECASLAYVGADVLGSAIAMDKEFTKALWREAGLPCVPSITARKSDIEALDTIAAAIDEKFGWPVFVKPARCGSSVGTSKVASRSNLESALLDALHYDTKIQIEPFIDGRELECSVLGADTPRAFPPGEILSSHEFYDYEAKYLDPEGAKLVIPADVDNRTSSSVMETAIAAYKAAGLSGMARIDFFIDKKSGAILLNEANTIPGFTSISMFSMMCEAGGLSYKDLIEELLSLAMERKQARSALRFSRPS